MKKFLKYFSKTDRISFYICLFVSIFLLVFAFFTPPKFIIDQSVIIACSELWAFAALGVAVHAVHRGSDIHLKRGETEMTVNVPDEEDEKKESLD